MIRRLIDAARGRNRLRVGLIGLYDEGMCRHVHARIVASTLEGDTVHYIEYVHTCGDACLWLHARTIVSEQLGAW
jgi:hypothetical protein